MGLFAELSVDEVTVQDIAAAVDMTPAAVYYHFGSKEQILTEGMQQFRDALVDVVRDLLPEGDEPGGVRRIVKSILSWAAKHRVEATVYFVKSIGLNLTVEALRRETRVELIELLRAAVKSARQGTTAAEAGIVAVALVSLIETSIASLVNEDAVYRSIGARRYAAEVAAIAERITGRSD